MNSYSGAPAGSVHLVGAGGSLCGQPGGSFVLDLETLMADPIAACFACAASVPNGPEDLHFVLGNESLCGHPKGLVSHTDSLELFVRSTGLVCYPCTAFVVGAAVAATLVAK